MFKKKKHTIITGAASGIGKALALEFASQGHSLFLVDTPTSTLADVYEACRQRDSQAFMEQVDLTNTDHVELAAQAEEEMGSIDSLIQCAGIYMPAVMTKPSMSATQRVIEVNLTASINMANAAVPHLIKNEMSHLIFFASLAARKTMPALGSYCASKAGVVAAAQSAFEELRHKGVKVTSILPSFVNTPLTQMDSLIPEKMIDVQAIVDTINFVLNFHPSGCPTEIVVETQQHAVRPR